MKVKSLLVALLGFLSMKSYSQDGFRYLGASTDGTEYYYKIKNQADLSFGYGRGKISSAEVWVKNTEKTRRVKNKQGKYVTVGGGYTLSLFKFSCSEQTYTIDDMIKYNSKGNVVSSNKMVSILPSHIPPGSVVESLYQRVCYYE